jgi:hypothetical protein
LAQKEVPIHFADGDEECPGDNEEAPSDKRHTEESEVEESSNEYPWYEDHTALY